MSDSDSVHSHFKICVFPSKSLSPSPQVDSAQAATSITVLDRADRTAVYVTQNERHSTVFYSSGGENNALGVVVGDILGFKVLPGKGTLLCSH